MLFVSDHLLRECAGGAALPLQGWCKGPVTIRTVWPDIDVAQVSQLLSFNYCRSTALPLFALVQHYWRIKVSLISLQRLCAACH